MALIGRLEVPLQRFRLIHGNATFAVPEIVSIFALTHRMPVLGRSSITLRRFIKISSHALTICIAVSQIVQSSSMILAG